MNKKETLKAGKFLRVIIIAVALVIVAAAGLTVKAILDSKKEFYQDGYILVPSTEERVTTNVNEQYYFSEGTKYQNKLGEKIVFKDTSNKEVSVNATQFVHYLDGALGSFSKGVVLDLADIGQEQIKYYGVSEKTIITKEGLSYSMSYLGKNMKLNEFIWKISDDSYMVVSPQVTLHLNNTTDVILKDYVQVQYVAGGIARLVHQDGTYQTVADDAYLRTDSGYELRLTSRCFFKDGKETVSLDSMVIDSSTNLAVDENEDKLKLPTFHVINGKDGEDGDNGNSGDNGYEGETGGNGMQGGSGGEGQDGFDGVQGDGGDWGYDGKDGIAGENAENAGSSDGIASIDQLMAPKVSLETESYVIGPNGVTMNLLIDDPNGMLDGDLTWNIYSRDDMRICGEGTIPRGVTGQVITTSSLAPGVEYVLVVSGDYTNEGYSYSTDFLTKIFKTDSIGITIENVKITEDSIIVKTVKDINSQVGTYKLALYIGEEGTSNIATYMVDYAEGREFVFDNTMGVADGIKITSDTEYYVRLYDVKDATTGALISADVFKPVKTLKVTPHYQMENQGTIVEIPISEKLTKTITSSRYQSVAVSLDSSICDPDNGIIGYRYELFETSSIVGNINDAIPVQTKEVEEMQTVNFDIDPEKNYIARVVVIFFDNEKKVEISAKQTAPFKLEQSTYPAVSFVNVVNEYDSVSGYIMVEDNSVGKEMLLGHVNMDYPIVLTIAAKVGDPITINLYEAATPPTGSVVADNIKYYYFSQDGLSRETPYSMTVSGYVNETGQEWNTLVHADNNGDGIPDGIERNCFQYIAGANFNSGDPTPITLKANELADTGSSLFSVTVGFTSGTDEQGNPLDASYEVGNLEKLTFTLINKNTGAVLGTYANIVDTYADALGYEPRHESIFLNEAYSEHGAPQVYSNNIVLTDASFGVEGDSRIAAGGTFQIRLENAYDYTQRSEYQAFTNDMEIDPDSYVNADNKIIYEFVVEQRHVQVADPNDTVSITEIQNQDAMEYNDALDDETVVGLKIDSGYTVEDATSIVYYIYEVTSTGSEPVIDDASTDVLTKNIWSDSNGVLYEPVAVKTIQVTNSSSEGAAVKPWVVYFDINNTASEYANVDDNSNTIFKRGKLYFVRYEIITDGTLEDVNEGDRYPECVYRSIYNDANDYPFYRSEVFGLKRQEPKIQRYLWDVTTDDSVTTHVWKYKLYDPDNAILTYFSNSTANTRMIVNQYASFENAVDLINGSSLVNASLTELYGGGNSFVDSFVSVDVTNLSEGKWYTLSIPYCSYGKNLYAKYIENGTVEENINENVSVPTQVQAVSAIKTDVLTGVVNPAHPTDSTDYAVNGVMVKGISTNAGLGDDYGYRIKITLQGSQIDRVAGVRVTVTGEVNNNPVTVIYDPVEVVMADGKTGTKNNNYGFAYLEYAPIVAAGINNSAVKVQVEAYYTTYQGGIKSFTEYVGTTHLNEFTLNGFKFTNNSAWAIKQYSYNITSGTSTYEYSYQRITDTAGTFIPSSDMIKDLTNSSVVTKTLSGSIFIPASTGFADNELKFYYTTSPMNYTTLNDNSFSDVKYYKNFSLVMDEIGAAGTDGKYYHLEKLNLVPLQIDCGDDVLDYKTADFLTGDGMPGIAFSNSASSAGMKSLYAVFDIKGELPGTDKGYYIYLYDAAGNEIGLDKYIDADGNPYYLVEGSPKSSDGDVLKATASNGTDTDYGTVANGNKVEFAIRGLNSGTMYSVKIMAKNSTDTMQYLFDYSKEAGAIPYQMKTTDNVIIEASDIVFKYNEYDNKFGYINYGIEGSEGTGMRIFYRVYDGLGNEVDCGLQEKKALGYLLVPKGNNIKYYHSDKTQCNPITINFNPGQLAMGATYTVVLNAYLSDNSGNILDSSNSIGSCTTTFTTPTVLSEPVANLQVIAGKESLQVSGTMTDVQRTIMDDRYVIAVYDLEGNKVVTQPAEIVKEIAAGSTKTAFSGTFEGLNTNSTYIVKVTASVDTNNNGSTDGTYEYALATSTVAYAFATVSVSYTVNEELILSLEDVTNFEDVAQIKYTIDSYDGSINYTNGTVNLTSWTENGVGSYSYITGYKMESGQYYYTLQYYSSSGKLLGSNTGRFNK